jgi:hypothetical protein
MHGYLYSDRIEAEYEVWVCRDNEQWYEVLAVPDPPASSDGQPPPLLPARLVDL